MKHRSIALSLALLVMGVWLFGGCTGEISIGDPNVEMAKLSLRADATEALQAADCVEHKGQQGCTRYPNPLRCLALDVSIRGDGSTVGTCEQQDQEPIEIKGVSQGIPFACRFRWNDGCVQCMDLYGAEVVDTCGDKPEPPGADEGGGAPDESSPGWGANDGDPDDVAPPAPPGDASDSCAPIHARQLFVKKFNEVLQKEGLKFSYQPDLNAPPPSGGFFEYGGEFANKPEQICDGTGWGGASFGVTACTNFEDPEKCYCSNNTVLGARCYCARMNVKALQGACSLIPPECDRGAWAAALWGEDGAASKWLTGGTWFSNPLGGVAPTVEQANGPEELTCIGSPLVLDLEGDGVELTSAAEGVTFNLTGHGSARTAWVRGADDALLVLDRNGNGSIDHGAELFGEAAAADGFAALARLDRPQMGGNGNGLLDQDDLMFDQLQLWADRDTNGISRPDELRSLREAGITGLQVSGTRQGHLMDGHGNDLSLRASYLRSDGSSGMLVDVYFVNR